MLLWEFYESIMETLEVMSDPELMAAIRQAEQEIAEGKGEPLDDVLKKLGWE